jgi:hypothetical protein
LYRKYGSILFEEQLASSEKDYKSTMDLAIKYHRAYLMEKKIKILEHQNLENIGE